MRQYSPKQIVEAIKDYDPYCMCELRLTPSALHSILEEFLV